MRFPAASAITCVGFALIAAGALADEQWCGGDFSKPYPAPKWSELEGTPDLVRISDNFRVQQSLRLIVSTLEKAIGASRGGESQAGDPNAEGVCLCNCGKDATYWASFLRDTLTDEAREALQKTEDRYIADVETKIEAARQTLFGAIPQFEKDVAKIVESSCTKAPSACTGSDYARIATAAQKELDAIVGPSLTQAALDQLATDAKALRKDVAELRAIVEAPDAPLASPDTWSRIHGIADRTTKLYKDLRAATRALADLIEKAAPADWANRVSGAVETEIATLAKDQQAFAEALRAEVRSKAEQRIASVRKAGEEIYATATDGEALLDEFGKELAAGLLASLQSVEGCYGVVPFGRCNVGDFCKGTDTGTLFGSDDLKLPLWMPTDVFKDGKSALKWALSTFDWLETLKNQLDTSRSGTSETMSKLVAGLKNAQEILETVNEYSDRFTDGFHLGAYSDIRRDLHMCVGYAGHGVMAELFSTSGGNFRGGADYLSANLSEKHRFQLRSGGFALFVNGRHLPLLPGVEANAQVDAFRVFDKHHLFGIEAGIVGDGEISKEELESHDIFNLVECCTTNDPNEICVHCPVTVSSQFYTGRYPVSYKTGGTSRVWPRTGLEWERREPITSIFGAGVNVNLEAKTKYWNATPIPLFPGATVTPWLSLDAGVKWTYGANVLRKTLQEQINKRLPAGSGLTEKDFGRDMHPFQAPDATEDLGNGAHVNPKLGADLVLGINLSSYLKVGVTANLYVSVDVDAGGHGGILDLNRELVRTLENSNPTGPDCRPVIANESTRVCSNEAFRKKGKCANLNLSPAELENCEDASPPATPGTLYSTGTYACTGESLACGGAKGYCADARGKIIAHDVTREQCERATSVQTFSCIAPYRDNPSGGTSAAAVARSESYVARTMPAGISPASHRAAEVAKAQAGADRLETEQACTHYGWCWNWGYRPGVAALDYVAVHQGQATSQANCPAAFYRNDPARPILAFGTNTPLPSQFIRFEWRSTGTASTPSTNTFHPYQCMQKPRPRITGYTGRDCNPVEYGYPSACADGEKCACDPGSCPPGRICSDGACVTACDASTPCPEGYVCAKGGCVLANGVPFAQQIVWRMRHAAQPQHAIASYGLNKLEAGVAVGLGLRIGLDYRLFRNWKKRSLVDLQKVIPLVALPLVKHQLGLEALYQDDCSAAGTVRNHQPALVTRYGTPNRTTTDLVTWCQPSMAANVQNPAPLPTAGDFIAAGLEETLEFGQEIGMDFWSRGQMCIGGKPWDQYFRHLQANPSELWPRLRCAYRGQTLPCTSPSSLQTSLIGVLGCLDLSLPVNRELARRLGAQAATFLTADGRAFALERLLIADDGEINRENLEPAIVALATGSQPFALDAWLGTITACTSDHPTGRFVETDLEIALDLSADELELCGGACCENGRCRQVSEPGQCGGVFQPGLRCGGDAACANVETTEPASGACFVDGTCRNVLSKTRCDAGAAFYAGKTCSAIPTACEEGTCPAGSWCAHQEDGSRSCVPFVAEGQRCGGFVYPYGQRCAAGLECASTSPASDIPGVCRRACVPQPRSLAAWWPLDEHAGGLALDVLARNDGHHSGGPVVVSGMVNRGLRFDGVNDFVEVPNAADLDFGTGDFSIALWLRTTQRTGTQTVLDKRRSNPYRGYSIYIWNGRPGLQLADGTYTNYSAARGIADGQWHLVVVTVDRNRKDGIRIYVDGVEAAPAADPTRHRGTLSNSAPLRFGRRTVDAGGWWRGDLDEPVLFHRALTAAEVTRMSLAEEMGLCRCATHPRALAWWRFEPVPFGPAQVDDWTPAGHHGTPLHGPVTTAGKVGSALQFDGADDVVEVPDANDLDIGTGDFSIEAWVRTSNPSPQVIVSKMEGGRTGYELLLRHGRPVLHFGDGKTASFTCVRSLADGAWHHLAVTVERLGGVRFYVDGAACAMGGAASSPRGSLANDLPLRIGAGGSSTLQFRGTLDEIVLYPHALPSAAIAASYRSGILEWCNSRRQCAGLDCF